MEIVLNITTLDSDTVIRLNTVGRYYNYGGSPITTDSTSEDPFFTFLKEKIKKTFADAVTNQIVNEMSASAPAEGQALSDSIQ